MPASKFRGGGRGEGKGFVYGVFLAKPSFSTGSPPREGGGKWAGVACARARTNRWSAGPGRSSQPNRGAGWLTGRCRGFCHLESFGCEEMKTRIFDPLAPHGSGRFTQHKHSNTLDYSLPASSTGGHAAATVPRFEQRENLVFWALSLASRASSPPNTHGNASLDKAKHNTQPSLPHAIPPPPVERTLCASRYTVVYKNLHTVRGQLAEPPPPS